MIAFVLTLPRYTIDCRPTKYYTLGTCKLEHYVQNEGKSGTKSVSEHRHDIHNLSNFKKEGGYPFLDFTSPTSKLVHTTANPASNFQTFIVYSAPLAFQKATPAISGGAPAYPAAIPDRSPNFPACPLRPDFPYSPALPIFPAFPAFYIPRPPQIFQTNYQNK